MNLRDFRHLVALADELHFGRAADLEGETLLPDLAAASPVGTAPGLCIRPFGNPPRRHVPSAPCGAVPPHARRRSRPSSPPSAPS